MSKLFIKFIIIFGCLVTMLPNSAAAYGYTSGARGIDMSWPNCNNLDISNPGFGIIGVNGGLSFTPNQCVGEESSLFKQNLSLYVNSGFPGAPYDLRFARSSKVCEPSDDLCMAYNYGYNSGLYAVNYALSHGAVSNQWWIDAEIVNSWSYNTNVNIQSLIGERDAIEFSTGAKLVGFYSFQTDWKTITGNWKTSYPIWQPTNNNSFGLAVKSCRQKSFGGTLPIITQYLNKAQTLDLDLVC